VDKYSLFIIVDSDITYNFINFKVTDKLQCNFTTITPLTIKAANRWIMICLTMCRNFKWKMHEVNFMVDVFNVELNNYDMVLGIQWLAMLGDIVSNYKKNMDVILIA